MIFPTSFILGTATSAFQIEGIPVLGYFHWSTFDNFKLAHGPSRRFGLKSVDFKSPKLETKIKPSVHYYHKNS